MPRSQVQALSWALLDERISDEELSQLNQLLLTSADAWDTYIDCVQLHTDLIYHFRKPPEPAVTRTGKSLVLGFLNEGPPSVALEAPTSGDVS